jgi:hypothetical protein
MDRLQQTGATSEKTEGALHGVSEATERTESGEAATVLKTLKHNYRLNEGFRKYLPLTDGTQLRSGQKKKMFTDGTKGRDEIDLSLAFEYSPPSLVRPFRRDSPVLFEFLL